MKKYYDEILECQEFTMMILILLTTKLTSCQLQLYNIAYFFKLQR